MKKTRYVLWVAGVEAVGLLSGILSRQGIGYYSESVSKPPQAPPAALFPVVWTILYALMGIGAARVEAVEPGSEGRRALNIFVIQLVVNFFWSLIFFNAQAYGFALVWLLLLWVLIIVMIIQFLRIDKTAGMLQIPYLLWVTFAAYLNYGVWQLNL